VTNVSNISAVTENTKNISNVLENVVKNTFTTETVTNCVMNINNSQVMKYKDIESTDGNVRVLNLSQDQAATAVSQCGAITDATNTMLTQTLGALDIKVDDTNSLTSDTTQKGTAKGDVVANGPLEGLAGLFSGWVTIVVAIVIGLVILIMGIILIKIMLGSKPTATYPNVGIIPPTSLRV
jgi:hypothetical protein